MNDTPGTDASKQPGVHSVGLSGTASPKTPARSDSAENVASAHSGPIIAGSGITYTLDIAGRPLHIRAHDATCARAAPRDRVSWTSAASSRKNLSLSARW